MEWWESIFIHALSKQSVVVTVPDAPDLGKWFETECYRVLRDIRAVLEDDSLSDPECFRRIEDIVSLFEALGSGAGTRHDFG